MQPRPSPDRDQLHEELLVLHAREGSREAFAGLVQGWQARLWRHARRLTESEEAAWDVVQETWLAAAQGIGRLRDAGAFRTWVYAIATRRAASRVRGLRRGRGASLVRIEDQPAAEPQARGAREEAVLALRVALRGLAGDERALVELFYLEGLSVGELSRMLEVPEGTVKSRLHSCRRKLRDALERMER